MEDRPVLMQSRRPSGYREMTPSRLASYLARFPEVAARLGGHAPLWRVEVVEGGRLNHVFLVEGPAGAVCVKQALPYVRALGESWPLPPERITFEEAALNLYARFAPGLAPRVIHYDSELFLMVMERLAPHVTLRRGLIDGRTFPLFPDHMARFLAQTLFHTSDLALPSVEKRERIAFFCANADLGKLLEDQLFVLPYAVGAKARWTAPQLDALVGEIQGDHDLKRAVATLELKFMAEPQALAHGDLRAGSIMVTSTDTKVIDPEFASFAPIGLDLGRLLGSLLLGYFSQDGHAGAAGRRVECERWLLGAVEQLWRGFHDRFLGLWRSAHTGGAYPERLFEGPDGRAALQQAQTEFMRRVFEDALRFAGASMIGQTLGLLRNQGLAAIADPEQRARCERRVLRLARELVKDAHYVGEIAEVTAVAREIREAEDG